MPPRKRKFESCEDNSTRTDLYNVLRIAWGASQREVVQAYHRRALEVHPDRGGDAELFQEVAYAYEVLSDPGTRHQYDVSLLELGKVGANLEAVSNAGTRAAETHVLADFPSDFLQVLLASPPNGWQELLRGFSREQLQRLLDCLSANPQQIKMGKKPYQQTKSDVAEMCNADLSGSKYLHSHGKSWAAAFTICGLNLETPCSRLMPVLAFYHSSVVELRRRLLQLLQSKPDVEDSLKTLGATGFQCRFTFRCKQSVEGKEHHTPQVDDLAMALEMRRDLQQASTCAQVKSLKKRWDRMLQEGRAEVEARRLQKAHELRGYILCQQEVGCDVTIPRRRRHSKQPPGWVKIELAELERLLGKKSAMQLLAPRETRLALPPVPPCGWKQMPMAERTKVLAMTSLKDLVRMATANKACREEVREHLGKEAVLSPQDFTGTEPWLQVVSVLNKPFLRETRCLDLRQMPASVISSAILWATLARVLPYLVCVFIHQSHAPCEPASLLKVKRFSIQVVFA
eukprot:Skav212129  [mRNA]  locus=scaffold1323:45816:47357:+ [translate_table: standard]